MANVREYKEYIIIVHCNCNACKKKKEKHLRVIFRHNRKKALAEIKELNFKIKHEMETKLKEFVSFEGDMFTLHSN